MRWKTLTGRIGVDFMLKDPRAWERADARLEIRRAFARSLSENSMANEYGRVTIGAAFKSDERSGAGPHRIARAAIVVTFVASTQRIPNSLPAWGFSTPHGDLVVFGLDQHLEQRVLNLLGPQAADTKVTPMTLRICNHHEVKQVRKALWRESRRCP